MRVVLVEQRCVRAHTEWWCVDGLPRSSLIQLSKGIEPQLIAARCTVRYVHESRTTAGVPDEMFASRPPHL